MTILLLQRNRAGQVGDRLMRVAVIIPVLRRPWRVAPLLDSVNAATEEFRVLFVASPGDDAEIAELERCGAEYIVMPERYEGRGDYARKINAGYRATTEPLIFTGADDLRFHPGWLDRCVEKLRPGVGVIGTNDLGNPRTIAGVHSTHSLVTREYADFGTADEDRAIYHCGYAHEFCDDELIQTAIRRGAYVHARRAIVEHLHLLWGKAPHDDVYGDPGGRFLRSRALFLRRLPLWQDGLLSRTPEEGIAQRKHERWPVVGVVRA